ncbi:MAG: MaoC family dehydratase N-terminal domain-containing protein [Chloroflexi bacterium]|nr:MaoC family dehydratase N-terminal domain-containing protein [Chloroflexota bacterium]
MTTTQAPPGQHTEDLSIDQFIQESRRLIGQQVADVPAGTAISDWASIERVADATGDDNPLFCDVRYGAASYHRTMLAPPAFVLAVRTPNSTGALYQKPYGYLDLLGHADIEWNEHIILGDRLTGDIRVVGAGEGPAWRGRRTAKVVSEVTYSKDGRPFARARGAVKLYPIARGSESFVDRDIYRYSDEEITQLERELDATPPCRGRVPRFWDDVAAGDALPRLVKGPLTLSDLMAWLVAEAKPVKLGGLVHKDVLAMPGRARPNPSTDWPHWDVDQEREDLQSCKDSGFPGPIGRESMRLALASQLITHWMGDDAFLRRLSVSLPNPFIYGDTMRLTGSVRDKFTQQHGGRTYYAVEVEISGTNQLGETVLAGTAQVFLPRSGEQVVLPIGS